MKRVLGLTILFYRPLMRLRSRMANKNTWLLLCGDCFLIACAHFFAHAVRFEFQRQAFDVAHYLNFIPFVIAVRIPVFYVMRLYSGMWRYTGLRDLLNIIKAIFISSLIIVGILLFENRFNGFSRGVLVLDTIFTFLLICGFRVCIRWIMNDGVRNVGQKKISLKRLLIIGAGSSAEKTVREIVANKLLNYDIVGFLDDNPKKQGLRIHNIMVWGSVDEVTDCARETEADEILIALSAVTGPQMQRIVALCQSTKLPYKIIPGYGEVIDGRVSVNAIRDISYKDLLGRAEVKLENDKIGEYLKGKTVLITGGGGSIGSELTRQVVAFEPEKIILYDAGEENLYNIQMELLHEYGIKNVVPVLGKVQDLALLNKVFKTHRPTVVFHAAAYKHVPLIENNPWQAVDNNILASQFLIEAAIIYGVERFVIISTDKAVRPTNVMGASKRMAELLMSAYRRKNWQGRLSEGWSDFVDVGNIEHNTVFTAVRFGNVLGSSGSVIPLFERQIKMGGPLTVTHPDITRYFMSIEEAAQLILQTGSMAKGGEIFILKMGDPVKIVDLAKSLIELAGKKFNEDIKISFTGLREGEKLYEELIAEGEGIVPTDHEKIMVLQGDGQSYKELEKSLAELARKASKHDTMGIKEALEDIIPEYKPDLEAISVIKSVRIKND